ncbi:Adenosylcobinamide-phosphate guanylyltransferase [hydrothermal vent metagenome]|uniref:Adenosylcobinamide kinase n=1 Tax=hydrothermal vent metagenome TaxID=652676 RepID=A0A3B1EA26_9ZZZZ
MFILYFGGQKSGKSKLAELAALKLAQDNYISTKPFYIATYNNTFNDMNMQKRINKHRKQRGDKFINIQEQFDLPKVIKENQTYLVDCISMWIFNHLETSQEYFIQQIKQLSHLNTNIVFVLNDVNCGIIPTSKMGRKFVDLTGVVGQKLAQICDKVYEVKLGIQIQIK